MHQELKPNFVKHWIHNVRPIALKCADGFKTMMDVENGKQVDDTDEGMIKIKKSGDANAIWFIGLMIGDIDRGVSGLNLINSLSTVNGCLTSESYWTNVWKNDYSSEEAKNLKELASLMDGLMSKL